MISYDELINLGLSDRVISNYLKNGSLIAENDNYIIKSDVVLSNIMKRALMTNIDVASRLFNYVSNEYQFYYLIMTNSIDEACVVLDKITKKSKLLTIIEYFLFKTEINPEDIDVGVIKNDNNLYLYDLLNKYIYYREPDMVTFIILEMQKNSDLDFELFMINQVTRVLPVSSEYFYDNTDFNDNKVGFNYLTELERKLLFFIEIEDYEKALNLLDKLSNIYSKPISLMIVYLLIKKLKQMSIYHKLISSRDENVVLGDPFSVLLELIKNEDYYRFVEVVDELTDSLSNFSYVLEIYRLLIDRILLLNQSNLEHITKELRDNSNGTDEDIKLFGKYNLSSIPIALIENSISFDDIEIEENVDYYELYLKYYKDANYISAKDNLIKHIVKLKREKKKCKLEYLVKELDVLKYYDEKNTAKIKGICEEAKKAELNGNILESISLMEDAKCQNPVNPFDIAYIGSLYYQLGNYEEAYKYLNNARKSIIKPEHYVTLLLCLLKMDKYQETLELCDEYFDFYGEDINIVHYIKSICYLKLEQYEDALDEITSIEAINVVYHNNCASLDFEKNIIEDKKNGGSCEFTMDDYIEFGLQEKEIPLYNRIKRIIAQLEDKSNISEKFIEEAENIDDLNSRIEYLVSIMKILFLEELEFEGGKIADYIAENVENSDSVDNKEKILRIAYAYNCNFLIIDE